MRVLNHYLEDLFHFHHPSDDFLVPGLVALIVVLVTGPGLLQNTGGECSAVVVPVISGPKGGVLARLHSVEVSIVLQPGKYNNFSSEPPR